MKKRGETAPVVEEEIQEYYEEEQEAPKKKAKAKKAKKAKSSKKAKTKNAKKESGNKKEKKAKKKNHADPMARAVLPYADYDEENDVFINKNDTAFDILRICTKDLNNAGTDELANDLLSYTKAYRLINDDLKIYCLNFPCNTQKQMAYFDKCIERAKLDAFIPWLQLKQNELKFLQENTSQREFYMRVCGKTAEECAKNRGLLESALGDLCERCEYERRVRIMEKINNPTTFVFV